MKQLLTTYSKKMPTTTESKLFSNHRHSLFFKYSFYVLSGFSFLRQAGTLRMDLMLQYPVSGTIHFYLITIIVTVTFAWLLQCPVSWAVYFYKHMKQQKNT